MMEVICLYVKQEIVGSLFKTVLKQLSICSSCKITHADTLKHMHACTAKLEGSFSLLKPLNVADMSESVYRREEGKTRMHQA